MLARDELLLDEVKDLKTEIDGRGEVEIEDLEREPRGIPRRKIGEVNEAADLLRDRGHSNHVVVCDRP
jgi:hypothetical protein